MSGEHPERACPICGAAPAVGVLCASDARALAGFGRDCVRATEADPGAGSYLVDAWGRRLAVDAGVVVGRGASASIVIDHPSVGEREAVFAVGPGGLLQLQSPGGARATRVNGAPVREPAALFHADQLKFGCVKLYYCTPAIGPEAAFGPTAVAGEPPAGLATGERMLLLEPTGGGGGFLCFPHRRVQLSLHLFELLSLLADRAHREGGHDDAGGYVAGDELLSSISWNTCWPTEANVRQLVCRLRRLLRRHAVDHVRIERHRDCGYRLRVDAPGSSCDAPSASEASRSSRRIDRVRAVRAGSACAGASPQPRDRQRCAGVTSRLVGDSRLADSTTEPAAYLVTRSGSPVPIADDVTLGRKVTNDVVIADPTVSRRHARLWRDSVGQWWVEDVCSANGVVVGSVRIEAATPLLSGQRLRLGDVALVFSLGLATDAASRGPDCSTSPDDWRLPRLRIEFESPTAAIDGVLRIGDKRIRLSSAQLRLLFILTQRMRLDRRRAPAVRGFVRSSELLGELPWNSPRPCENHLKQLVRRTRKAFAEQHVGDLIESRRGLGYRLKVDPGTTATESGEAGIPLAAASAID